MFEVRWWDHSIEEWVLIGSFVAREDADEYAQWQARKYPVTYRVIAKTLENQAI